MRIDNWSCDKVMQLPDCCFGRRWPVGLCAQGAAGLPAWDISEISLPERCLLWEVALWSSTSWDVDDYLRLALGDQLPTSLAMMDALAPLLHGVGIQGASPRFIRFGGYSQVTMRRLRLPIDSRSMHPILEVAPGEGNTVDLQVVLTFSSFPREVPDWLISGQGKNL